MARAVLPLAAAAAAQPPAEFDLRRARARAPRPHLTAPAERIHAVLNAALLRDPGVRTRPCAEWGAAALNDAIRGVWRHTDARLHAAYAAADGRRLRHATLAGYEAEWGAEGGADAAARRDGKCAEAAMLYTHHTTHAGRAAARAAGVVVPLLSPYRAAHAAADAVYAAQNTCLTGHDDRTDSGCHDLPCWPEEVQWNGTGHGKYPFWVGANGCSKSPAAIQTSWSQTKQSEKFVHSSCDLSTVGGPASGPCTHLFVEWGAWMYTPDESFCCISGCGNTPSARAAPANSSSLLFPPASCSSGNAQPLTAPQSDFMKTFTYNGVSDNYVGTYYSGKVKNYTMGALSTRPFIGAFWYFTDLDDNPIEQGEGPQVWPRDICNQGASYVYHEYGQFAKASLDASVFDVPAVCKTTTTTCMFP